MVTGCSDSDGPRDTVVSEGPAYLVATRVWDDTSTTSYFHLTNSVEKGTRIDTSKAIEVPGAAKLFAVDKIGWFAVGGGEKPTITRYSLDESGTLNDHETISLESYGIQSLWDTLYVISATKMYYPDREGQRLIVINPTEMTIDGEIDLAETGRDGYLAVYSYSHLTRGDDIVFSVAWIDWNETDSIVEETGLVVIDTKEDSVVRFDEDTRCGGITQPIVTEEGEAYFVSSALAAAAHRLGRLDTEPCVLRVDENENRFDPDYLVKLEELTDSAIAGEPVPGGGNSIFIRVFDEDLGTVTEDALTWELTSQAAWRWVLWDTATGGLTKIKSLPPSTSDVLWFEVDGKTYGSETREDYSKTTLIELTASGGPKEALTAPGFLHGVARIR